MNSGILPIRAMLRRMDAVAAVQKLAERAKDAGGRALVVGGAVRDRLFGLSPTDFDVEVYGLPPERVEQIVRDLGDVREVGKAFGVLEMKPSLRAKRSNLFWFGGLLRRSASRNDSDITLHVSIPRRESKVAPGHRGFAVDTDPTLSIEEAARRRDFTINAIAEDPLTGEVIDPFHGRDDLQRQLLRVVDAATFGDDPLRVLRGAVFAAQFELAVESATDALIRQIVSTSPRPQPSPAQKAVVSSVLQELPRERVGEEWRKLLLRPRAPSRGLRLLMDWGAFGVLHPEFAKLPETPQNPKWHPEGDVWTHTMMTVDEAAVIVRGERAALTPALTGAEGWGLSHHEDQWSVLLAALCHDLGKATTTREIGGVWRSIGHDAAGVQPTQRFLRQIAADHRTRAVVVRLVREHLQPLHCFNAAAKGKPASDGAVRKLARRLHPATVYLLSLVADADHRGRGQSRVDPSPHRRRGLGSFVEAGVQLRARADQLGVLRGPPAPVLRGTDLVALGLPPSPAFGAILRRAQELRDEQGLSRDALLARLRGARTSDEALTHLSSPES